jgi:hypothetical protein
MKLPMPRDITMRPKRKHKHDDDDDVAGHASKSARPQETFLKPPNIKTLVDLVEFDEIPYPTTANCSSAGVMMTWITQAHSVLARTLIEFDEPNGALNQMSGFRQKVSVVAHGFGDKHVALLHKLRSDLELHLSEYMLSLSRPVEGSGGDTARWSVGTNIWVIICMISCVLRRFGLGEDVLKKYNPWSSAYLRAQKLVLDTVPVMDYSLRSLIDTITNWLERLDSIKTYRDDLWDLLKVIKYALAKYIVGAGEPNTGWDASEWTAPIGMAQTAEKRDVVTKDGKTSGLECVTTDFVCHSALWVTTIENYLRFYVTVSRIAVPLPKEPTKEEVRDSFFKGGERMTYKWIRTDAATTRKLSWFPSDYVIRRATTFFCVYAYMSTPNPVEARSFAVKFAPLPSDSSVFRAYTGMEVASPKDVLTYKFLNRSATGTEFTRIIQFDRPVLDIIHDWWNWRDGETRIRSSSMQRLGFERELIWIYLIDLFFANNDVKDLRTLININHRDSTAMFSLEEARRSGQICIIQQFGKFTVMMPAELPANFAYEESNSGRDEEENVRNAESFIRRYAPQDLDKTPDTSQDHDHDDHDHETQDNEQSAGLIGEHSSASHQRRRLKEGYVVYAEDDQAEEEDDEEDQVLDYRAVLKKQKEKVDPVETARLAKDFVYDPKRPSDPNDPYWTRDGGTRWQQDEDSVYHAMLKAAIARGWKPPPQKKRDAVDDDGPDEDDDVDDKQTPAPKPVSKPGVAIVTDADDDDGGDSESLFGDNDDMLADVHAEAAAAAEAAGVPGEDEEGFQGGAPPVMPLEPEPEEEVEMPELEEVNAADVLLPPEIGNAPLDKKQQLEALRALQAQDAEDGVEDYIRRRKMRGAQLPEDLPDQTHIRCYDCDTYLEAFLVFGIALCYFKKGQLWGADYNDFFNKVCGWRREGYESDGDEDADNQ